MRIDPAVATMTAVTLTPAIYSQLVPPAHEGPNRADPRRYRQAAAVSIFVGGFLSLLSGEIAPLALSAASAGALIGLREWALVDRQAAAQRGGEGI